MQGGSAGTVSDYTYKSNNECKLWELHSTELNCEKIILFISHDYGKPRGYKAKLVLEGKKI